MPERRWLRNHRYAGTRRSAPGSESSTRDNPEGLATVREKHHWYSNYAPEVYSGIVDAALHEMALLQPKVATFVILTHNTLDYGSTEEPRRALMLSMLRYLKAKADEGWEVIPAGLADVRQALLA